MKKPKSKSASSIASRFSSFIIILAVAAAAYVVSFQDFFHEIELTLYDFNFQLRGPKSVSDSDIALVVIDQPTADSLSFPFDRKHYATLIRKLNRLGAKRIVFDIQLTSVGINPVSDSILYQTIKEAGNVVLVGKLEYRFQSHIKEPLTDVVRPSQTIAHPGTPWGMANDLIDPDGILRQYPFYFQSRDSIYYSLSMVALAVESGWKLPINALYNEDKDFIFGYLDIPTYHPNSTLLNYFGPAGTFPTYSLIDVVSGAYDFDDLLGGLSPEELEILKEAGAVDLMEDSPFKDKIVFIGASAEDLQDNKFTPFFTYGDKRKTPGVEVHAHALEMFFQNDFIRKINELWIIIGTVLLSLASYLLERKIGKWIGLIGVILILGLITFAAWMLFEKSGLWLHQVPLMTSVIIGYPTNLAYSVILTQREKAQLKGMFGHYVPPAVIDQLQAHPEMLKLGGERRRMSVLFTDIRGFTTVSEKLQPEELVALLYEYLTAMTNVILDNDGIIDKYEGDLIMAEFGAPVYYEDHAARCCRAALGMQNKLKEMRVKWKEEGRDELYSRVGVNTGDMILGNMGSEDVFDYTVMGDAVNLSSRLEGANKGYGTFIMIGPETYKEVKDSFATRPLDIIQVKGKKLGVEVYELLAEHEHELSAEKLQAVELFKEGLKLYRKMKFEQALEVFNRALKICPDDSPSVVYARRCQEFIDNPPPDDWDGIWVLTEK